MAIVTLGKVVTNGNGCQWQRLVMALVNHGSG